MVVDAHLHCSGNETVDDVLRALDEANVDIGVLLAPFLTRPYRLDDERTLRQANEYVAKLIDGHGDRLVGLAVVNPALEGAADDARNALETLGLAGLKLVPSRWYPYDDCAHAIYEVAARCGAPILFHAGVFIDGVSGRFCRPMYYEAVREHRGLKATLAHLGWPWCDEAIAVGIIDLINGVSVDDAAFRFDISFGPPPSYRHEVLGKALACLTAGLLQFGSDRFLPCTGAHIASAISEVRTLCSDLDVSKHDIDRLMAGTALAWLGRK